MENHWGEGYEETREFGNADMETDYLGGDAGGPLADCRLGSFLRYAAISTWLGIREVTN